MFSCYSEQKYEPTNWYEQYLLCTSILETFFPIRKHFEAGTGQKKNKIQFLSGPVHSSF